ncbi:LysR family transcriptional regulator [Corticibacter populi]|uniref:LysR family transcriptional regulator n=1 Tax=Corticibacter populi TaxID=1550736 RepID=A0A3M6QV71_9BURK|nr:LysR substrate-binding domain-containing protein [Corticibacter populi]RMX06910.1 LysR family transcriptional regulator [Corticibacter populi]RZS31895.1 DNA-binding transcriptional LysR family regulator [Corticibacter populi]
MRLRLLHMFSEVVRTGSFTAAATTSHASQSTVSKAVHQLEEELGVVLLERSMTPLRPTSAGELVLQHARNMLEEAQRMRDELAELQGLQRGVLRLGLPPLGSASLFAPLFVTFRQRYPQIDIQLVEQGSRRLEELLLRGDIELAATLLPVPEALEAQFVFQSRLVAVLATDHPLAGCQEIALAELAETPFIFYEAGFALNAQLRHACMQQGFEPREATHSGQVDFVIALVAAGYGVAFLPELMVPQQAQRQTRFIPIRQDEGTLWQLALAWPRQRTLSPAALKWLELSREKLGGGPAGLLPTP